VITGAHSTRKKTGENDLKDFSFTSIELPKFKVSELRKDIEKWCIFSSMHQSLDLSMN
ncbi:hypothetical protein MHYMCMPSP_00392, partial [Hyalomma marginatum]